jgi:hypothetical protein
MHFQEGRQACSCLLRQLSCLAAPPLLGPPPPPSRARPSLSSPVGRYGEGPRAAAAAHQASWDDGGTRNSALPYSARPSLRPPPSPLACGRPSPLCRMSSGESEGNMPRALPPLLELQLHDR